MATTDKNKSSGQIPANGQVVSKTLAARKPKNLLIILVILLIAIGVFATVSLHKKPLVTQRNDQSHYQVVAGHKTTTYSVSGLSFQYPLEFKESHKYNGKDNTTVTYADGSIGFSGVSATKSSLASDI
jgi:hypothetical protein